MILTRLEGVTVFRMMSPKWAFDPTSGAGAAKHGGRVNRPGIEALYVALDAETAICEYQQVSSLLPPGTLVSYCATVAQVVDFRAGFDAMAWPDIWESFFCDWRSLWFNQRTEPPSWVIGDEVLGAGAAGILFPSALRHGGLNLVLFMQAFGDGDSLAAFDPGGQLPKNQSSWQ